MTLSVKLAHNGEALEKHGTMIHRAPTGLSRTSPMIIGGDLPSPAADEDEEDEEDEDEEDAPVKG